MGPWGDESAGYGQVVSRRVCTILPTYLPTVVFWGGGRDKGGRGETKPAIFIIMVVIINHQSINHSHYLNFLIFGLNIHVGLHVFRFYTTPPRIFSTKLPYSL